MSRLLRSQALSAAGRRPVRSGHLGRTRTITAVAASAAPTPAERVPTTPANPPAPPPPPSRPASRRDRLKEAEPFSHFLTDTFGRQHDYLRISLTERCNLRCVYCMPEEGVPLSPPRELLTTPEIVMLASTFVSQGVTKIRLTGGEPTVRRDILPLMRQLGELRPRGLRELCLTTNGISLHRKLEAMVEAGLTGVNLSLDTLDPWQFQIMTRRKGFDAVQRSVERIFELNRAGAGIRFKINCVVMRGVNDREIVPFVEMTRDRDVEVRFIEYMPFDGNRWSSGKMLGYAEMLDMIREAHPTLEKVRDHRNDTSKTWRVPGFTGRIGFITSMTHNFCGTCNRLRVTSDGNLKVCLFGNAEVSLRDILRRANGGEPIDERAFEAIKQIEMDRRTGLATTTGEKADGTRPLGLAANEEELLEVIGAAVGRKKAKHAGIGELEHMKNRPMILIDPPPTYLGFVPSVGARRGRLLHGLPPPPPVLFGQQLRPYSSQRQSGLSPDPIPSSTSPTSTSPLDASPASLTHVSPAGSAHMVSIADKLPTRRVAAAACTVRFSAGSPAPRLIRDNQARKGDVLGVARVAGIMAAKRTPDLIPLCHPVAVSRVAVDLSLEPAPAASGKGEGGEARQDAKRGSAIDGDGEGFVVEVRATVECEGKTGVEMEALVAASTAALTVYDMCKAVDRGMVVEGLRVVLKDGGKSGRWEIP